MPVTETAASLSPAHTMNYGQPAALESDQSSADVPSEKGLKALVHQSVAFSNAAGTTDDWAEADLRVRELLAAPSSVPLYQREQRAADVMLRHHLLEGPATSERLDALAFYTDLLVRNESPQSVHILAALERLEGHLPVAERQAAAARAARAGKAFVARRVDCVNCPRAEIEAALGVRFQQESGRHLQETLRATRKMEAIANA